MDCRVPNGFARRVRHSVVGVDRGAKGHYTEHEEKKHTRNHCEFGGSLARAARPQTFSGMCNLFHSATIITALPESVTEEGIPGHETIVLNVVEVSTSTNVASGLLAQ